MDAETLKRWLRACAAILHEHRDELTRLDAAIGDADHSSNMERGFATVAERLDSLGDVSPSKVLTTAGATLISTVGGASGPLWGTAFRLAGRSLGDRETFDQAQLAAALEAALNSIAELGGAAEGDKTMLDALGPATRAFRERLESGGDTAESVLAARQAAEEGMRATIPMTARKGRASYLGERSVGHQDPGATSTALIIAALERAIAEVG